MKKLYQNKEWLEEQYEKKPMAEIAEICNCSYQTIGNWLKKIGIPIRSLSEEMKGKKHSEERKKKMSKKMKEKYKNGYTNPMKGKEPWNKGKHLSEEHKKKIGESMKGQIPWMKDKHHSNETKQKISEIRKEMYKNGEIERMIGDKNPMYGKSRSDETKQKIRKKNLGKKLTKEQKQQISETWKQKYKDGYIHPMIGKHNTRSAETRKKISKTLKRKYKNGEITVPSGEDHYNYNHNREERFAPYTEDFYNTQIRYERWKLQRCRDLLTGDKLEWGFYSVFHHIDWNKKNDEIYNLCWITRKNHRKVHSKHKRKYYENLLKKNLQTLKYGKIPENWKIKNKKMFRQENMIQLQLTDKLLNI